MSDLIGQSLGRYHILEQLGEGGMATVYKAFDTRLERDVAVKIIRTERLTIETMPKALKRFEREAKALGKLTHPNIVPISDYGEHEGKPYLVMPYLPGGTLKQRLGKPIPWQEAMKILLPIAEALDYAHSQNMIHRDVKPANILLTQRGQPMLTDFGIAKILDAEETMELTGTSATVGTPEYMAPEQATAKVVDHRADIYALGVVLYEMITGRKPYIADTPMAVLIKHATEPLPRPKQFMPDLPEDVEKLLLKALAKNPADRYQDMAEMGLAFERLMGGQAQKPAVPKASEESAKEKVIKELAERKAMELASRKKAEQAAQEKATGLQPRTTSRQSVLRQPVMKWAVIGIIGLCIIGIGTGAWGISYLARLTPATETPAANQPSPTEVSSQESTIGNPITTERIKIGLSFSDQAGERWKNEEALMRRLLEEKGYEVISQEANHDVELQNAQIADMVAQGVKGLIVIAEDGAAIVPAVDQAVAAGVKVIAYDRLIKTRNISAYLSFNPVEVGLQEALGVMTALGLPGSTTWTKDHPARVVLSGGSPTDNYAVLVRQGQMEIVQPYIDQGVVKIVADQWVDNWDAANAEAMMKDILRTQGNRIDAVVASNDGTALGELQAMKAQGLAGKVPISGQDATADGCNSIVKGEQTVSVLKDIRLLSPKAVDLIDALLKGQPVSGFQEYSLRDLTGEGLEGSIQALFLPVLQVTKDNVYELIVKSGFQPYDDVYRDIPENQRPPRP